jgi:hypothetical protein
MRYPTESDFSQDRVYSSSRLAPEEIPLGNEDINEEEIPLANGTESDRPIPTIAAVVPQTATSIPSNPPAPSAKKESSKKRKESESDKEKRTPSFFSRSYIAWRNLANRGVYTPVIYSSALSISTISRLF